MSSVRQPEPLRVLWCGPFPAERNGIDEYARVITANLNSSVSTAFVRLSFSGWPRDYPLQVVRAASQVLKASFGRRRPLVHIQYCPFSTGPGALVLAAIGKLRGLSVISTIHEDRTALRFGRAKIFWLYPPIEDAVFALSDSIIVHSESQRQALPWRIRRKAQVVEFGVSKCPSSSTAEPAAPVVGCLAWSLPTRALRPSSRLAALRQSRCRIFAS